jgi:DNA-directed RNA polymerase subunit N (RpoN/RPB10)
MDSKCGGESSAQLSTREKKVFLFSFFFSFFFLFLFSSFFFFFSKTSLKMLIPVRCFSCGKVRVGLPGSVLGFYLFFFFLLDFCPLQSRFFFFSSSFFFFSSIRCEQMQLPGFRVRRPPRTDYFGDLTPIYWILIHIHVSFVIKPVFWRGFSGFLGLFFFFFFFCFVSFIITYTQFFFLFVPQTLGNLWTRYVALLAAGYSEAEAMDEVGARRVCCRRHFCGHVDLIDKLLNFAVLGRAADQQAGV